MSRNTERPGGLRSAPQEPATDDEPFLARWARRKRAIARGEPVADDVSPPGWESPPPPAPGPAQGPLEPDGLPPPPGSIGPDQHAGAPALTDADMPPIETLDERSDYSGFFSPKVSEELRRLALRKLFRSSVFNIRDGLDDYDEDFRSFSALGDIVTSDMRHHASREEAKLRAQAERADEPAHGRLEDPGAQVDSEAALAKERAPAKDSPEPGEREAAQEAMGPAPLDATAGAEGETERPRERAAPIDEDDGAAAPRPDISDERES